MRHHHSPGIRGQLMWFLCCICLFLLALVWFLSTQLLEPLYTKHIEKQLTTQAESITAELDKAIANGEALSAWSFGHLTVNTAFFDRLATQLYASGSLNSFCVDISDTTMRTIYKIENQSYCNLHETLLSDSANNDMIVSTAVAMRKKCRTTGGFVQTLNPPRLSGSAQLLVGRNTSGGEYTVLVTTSLVHVAEAGKVLSTVLPMAAALIFAFAMTAAWLFSEWFTKPLRQLSSAAARWPWATMPCRWIPAAAMSWAIWPGTSTTWQARCSILRRWQRDLLANVSHDLRTPLTLIKGYAETVRDITGDDKAHRDEQMNIIVDETDRLTALVSSVMELSKVTSGADKCERVHFDMGQLCDEVSERYDAICAQNGWQLQLELPDEELPVYADPNMMQRALHNLLGNAMHHIGKDGIFILRAQRCTEGVRIEVEDHGPASLPTTCPISLIGTTAPVRMPASRAPVWAFSITKAIFQQHGFRFGVQSAIGMGHYVLVHHERPARQRKDRAGIEPS